MKARLYESISNVFHFIYLSNIPLQSLSHCELITDEGIRHLGVSSCSTEYLEVLELDNCPLITDASLDHLLSCHNLQRIELYDCQLITRGGIKRLKVCICWKLKIDVISMNIIFRAIFLALRSMLTLRPRRLYQPKGGHDKGIVGAAWFYEKAWWAVDLFLSFLWLQTPSFWMTKRKGGDLKFLCYLTKVLYSKFYHWTLSLPSAIREVAFISNPVFYRVEGKLYSMEETAVFPLIYIPS